MKQFKLSMTAAGMMHYTPMVAIAIGGVFLGFVADRLGRKKTIIIGLSLFALNSYLYIIGNSFAFFLSLMIVAGIAIVFLKPEHWLLSEIYPNRHEHTSTMNTVEGFFAVGAIIGPAVVTYFLSIGIEWKWLYIVAGTLCVILIAIAANVKYPVTIRKTEKNLSI